MRYFVIYCEYNLRTSELNNSCWFIVARGLPRGTENNLDHSEILLDFLSAVLCQHFLIILKMLLLFITSQ